MSEEKAYAFKRFVEGGALRARVHRTAGGQHDDSRASGHVQPRKHSTPANRGPSGRLASRGPLGAGGRAGVTRPQSRVTTSSSRVLTGPWYLFLAETRYQTPKINGIRTASGT